MQPNDPFGLTKFGLMTQHRTIIPMTAVKLLEINIEKSTIPVDLHQFVDYEDFSTSKVKSNEH